jgi:hypothetical protein
VNLLENAVASIEMGVEDYQSLDERRVLSSLRNLYAGTLLLLKEMLSRESPDNSEILLYSKIIPTKKNGQLEWAPQNMKTTVDYQEIKERFKHLDLTLDWRSLDELRNLRNQAEHHAPKAPRTVALEALAACFLSVKQIIEDHLEEKPEHLFKGETWAVMLKERRTFEATEKQCTDSVAALADIPDAALTALKLIQCPNCSSYLLQASGESYVDAYFECRSCGKVSSLASVIVAAAELAHPSAYVKKLGFVGAIGRCPNCREDAFLIEEDICLACAEGRPFHKCEICGDSLPFEESDSSYCSYCSRPRDLDD